MKILLILTLILADLFTPTYASNDAPTSPSSEGISSVTAHIYQ